MNSDSLPSGGIKERALEPEVRQQMQSWRELLGRCGRKPGRKSVHELRVATLRMQAELEYRLSELPADATGRKVVRRLRRQGKKLRRALGPVRQADVFLNKLSRVRSWAGTESNGHAACPKECLDGITELERGITRKRGAAAKELTSEIKRRRKKLSRLSKKTEAAGAIVPSAGSGGSREILRQIEAAAAEFPGLDGGNLHEFRKHIKKIRYLAEIFARSDPAAARQAAALKRITGSVGEWHDWQALAEEAMQAGCEGAMKVLAEFLQAQAVRSLEQSLLLCRRAMKRLLKDGPDGYEPFAEDANALSDLPERKPVASVSIEAPRAESEPLIRAS
jgi:CHAD domain-containing protein